MTEGQALTRLAASELAAVPRGIGDIHAAISRRVFGALGPGAASVRVVHDTIAQGVYASVSSGLALGATTAGAFATARTPTAATPARGAAAPSAGAPPPGATLPGAPPPDATPRRDAALAALNALFGDRLHAEGSPLAIQMEVRRVGTRRGEHVVVFVHGLGETEHAWGSPGYGEALEGATAVHVRFNSGRHVSENGAALAALLDELVGDWPVPVRRISLVGHSLGGLVVRSACHQGGDWARLVRHVVTLGTPHTGAPLEQAVHALAAALDLAPETRPFSRLLRRRSAGIRDLRHGALLDEDWRGQDPEALRARTPAVVPPLPDATHCFVSATVTTSQRHPIGRLVGDALVLAPSASGRGRVRFDAGLELGGTHHLALLNHPVVAAQLREWLR